MIRKAQFITTLACSVIYATYAAAEIHGVLLIETRILGFDPQPGMKSEQTIAIDINKASGKVSFLNSYKTGRTNIGGGSVGSVRDSFSVSKSKYDLSKGTMSFRVEGQTASGVLVIPDIDYSFDIHFDGSGGKNKWAIIGCHDGYPAYKIEFTNKISGQKTLLYNFKHDKVELIRLLGSCDVKVENTTINTD